MRPILVYTSSHYYIHSGHFMLFVGGLAALLVLSLEIRRMGEEPDKIYLLLLFLSVAAVCGARLLYCLDFHDRYHYSFLEVVRFWKGGMALHGGAFLAFATYVVYVTWQGLDFWRTGDLLAPAMAAFVFFARIGCILTGCCYGRACDPSFPLAMRFVDPRSPAPKNVSLYPTEPLFATAALVVFSVLWIRRKHKRFDGEIALAGVSLFSLLAFLIEFLRGDLRVLYNFGDIVLSQNQVLGAGIFLVTAALYVHRWRQARDRALSVYPGPPGTASSSGPPSPPQPLKSQRTEEHKERSHQ